MKQIWKKIKQQKQNHLHYVFDNPFFHCPHTQASTNSCWEASIQGSFPPSGSLSQIIILVRFVIVPHISMIMYYWLFADFKKSLQDKLSLNYPY